MNSVIDDQTIICLLYLSVQRYIFFFLSGTLAVYCHLISAEVSRWKAEEKGEAVDCAAV